VHRKDWTKLILNAECEIDEYPGLKTARKRAAAIDRQINNGSKSTAIASKSS
jgi:hypothetical protein